MVILCEAQLVTYLQYYHFAVCENMYPLIVC